MAREGDASVRGNDVGLSKELIEAVGDGKTGERSGFVGLIWLAPKANGLHGRFRSLGRIIAVTELARGNDQKTKLKRNPIVGGHSEFLRTPISATAQKAMIPHASSFQYLDWRVRNVLTRRKMEAG